MLKKVALSHQKTLQVQTMRMMKMTRRMSWKNRGSRSLEEEDQVFLLRQEDRSQAVEFQAVEQQRVDRILQSVRQLSRAGIQKAVGRRRR